MTEIRAQHLGDVSTAAGRKIIAVNQKSEKKMQR